MTVTTTTKSVAYNGDGVTTSFPVPFQFFGNDELEVIERNETTGVETVKALTTDYTITGGAGATGTVIAVTAPPSGVSWTILRATKQKQETDYTDNDPFPAETHETGLDRVTMIAQDAEATVARAIRFSKTDADGLNAELPNAIVRANKFLGFDASGGVIAAVSADLTPVSSFIAPLLAAANSTDALAILIAAGIDEANTFSLAQVFDGTVDINGALTIDGTATVTGDATYTGKLNVDGPLALGDGSTLTITAGSVTPTANYHFVDTEAAAATDDLDTIAVTNIPDGGIVVVRSVDAARVPTVKHATGNLTLSGTEDFILDAPTKTIVLQRRGTDFEEITRSVAGASGLESVQVFTTTGANTWTKPSGITKVIAEGVGGGGGGGDNNGPSNGGGGGGYCKEFIDVTGTSSETATVGAGGAGGSGFAAGTAGGSSSFGSFWTAGGGAGGPQTAGANGGAGGSATGGDINIPGQKGQGDTNGRHGGKSMLGHFTYAKAATVEAGALYGSGGAGSISSGTNGAAGSQGIVIVWEYAG